MRGQCVDQLLKFHELFEKGVRSKEQHEEFQALILNEVLINLGFQTTITIGDTTKLELYGAHTPCAATQLHAARELPSYMFCL